MSTQIGKWATDTVLHMQPQVSVQLEDEPEHGLFHLAFDNSKKRGKGRQTRYFETWGYCFPESGHVVLDTNCIQVRDFRSMQQMRDHFRAIGIYSVSWQREGEG